MRYQTERSTDARGGFSLIELLVVIGIVALLLGILLPVLSTARAAAKSTGCASNLRQIATALLNYAADNRGAFPGNKGADHLFWYNADVLGKYAAGAQKQGDGTLGGGILVCPNDAAGAMRSYSMNIWASSVVSQTVESSQSEAPPKGKLFDAGSKPSEKLILAIEALWEDPSENELSLKASPAVVGWVGKPGQRFGVEPGMQLVSLRYGPIDCQLDYSRHRSWRDRNARTEAARGALHIAFADGHVNRFQPGDLATAGTQKSTLTAMWTPIDASSD